MRRWCSFSCRYLLPVLALLLSTFPHSVFAATCDWNKVNGGSCTVNRSTYSCSPDSNHDYSFECVCSHWVMVSYKEYGKLCGNPRGELVHQTTTYSTKIVDHQCVEWASSDYQRYASEVADDMIVNSCSAKYPKYHYECSISSYTYDRTFKWSDTSASHDELIKEKSCNQEVEWLSCSDTDYRVRGLRLGPNVCETHCWRDDGTRYQC